jgi:hypothetical protein
VPSTLRLPAVTDMEASHMFSGNFYKLLFEASQLRFFNTKDSNLIFQTQHGISHRMTVSVLNLTLFFVRKLLAS